MIDETALDVESWIRSIVVRHPAFSKAIKTLELQLDARRKSNKARLVVLIGDSGTGKSFLITVFKGNRFTKYRDRDGLVAQFVIAAVPEKSTPKGILEEILDGYDVKDINSRDTEGQLKRRAVTLIKNCQTEVLCIEEVQHLVDRRTLQVLGHAGDLFKVLHDNSTALVILSGLPQIRRLIRENPQLATRVRAYITLPRFSWKNERQRAQFISCLAAFETAIKQRFPNFPAISGGEWCYRMFCVCNGIMRLLANFLVEVLLVAGESNKFGLEQFADAYESFVLDATSEGSKIRPFDPDFLTLPTESSLSLVDSIGRDTDGRLEVEERENAGREDEKPPRAPRRARKARAANKR